MAAPQPPPPVVPVDEDEFEEFEDEGACVWKGRRGGLALFRFLSTQPSSLSLPSHPHTHPPDWDASAEAPPTPLSGRQTGMTTPWDDAFGQALAGALAQAQTAQPAAQQQ